MEGKLAQAEGRRKREAFIRRKKRFVRKANGLHAIFYAEIFVVIRHRNKFYNYNSKNNPSPNWPPATTVIVGTQGCLVGSSDGRRTKVTQFPSR